MSSERAPARAFFGIIALASVITLLVAAWLIASPAASAPGDTVADRLFGQPNFASGAAGCNQGTPSSPTSSTLCSPDGMAMDGAGNLYVADQNNSRVLEYNNPRVTDTVADRLFGQPNFNLAGCNLGGPSAFSLCGPEGVTVDSAGNLYVADAFNNRVLEYDNPVATDTVADRVFGQGGNFMSNICNTNGLSVGASSLCHPVAVAVDAAGHLYVADQGNHRVLEYDSPLTSQVANRVFGQGRSFTSNTCNLGGVSASSLCVPIGVAVDGTGNLYLADVGNNRVLEYDRPVATDTVADRVLGQGGSFTSNTCYLGAISASSLCNPTGVAVDASGHLYVADFSNNRVLEYDSPLTSQVANRVFGQGGSFTSNACNLGGISAASLCSSQGVAVDSAGNLYVAEGNLSEPDSVNHRVLEYDNPLATDTVADRVFGQPNFASGGPGCNQGRPSSPTAGTLCVPAGVALDGAGNTSTPRMPLTTVYWSMVAL